MEKHDLSCRGSWTLGTACGRCVRCIEAAKPTIDMLRAQLDDARQRLMAITCCFPPGGHGFDFCDEFKVRCFDEARRLLTVDRKCKPTPVDQRAPDGQNDI